MQRLELKWGDCCSTATTTPPVPPVKPLKLQHQLHSADSLATLSSVGPAELLQGPGSEAATGRTEHLQLSPADLRSYSPLESNSPYPLTDGPPELQPLLCSYVERLRREGKGDRGEAEEAEEKEGGERRGLDRSSYHHAIAALENTSEEEEEEVDKRRGKERTSFQRPVIETESTFRPAEFGSRLLPQENKPLEMVVLKRAKELLLSHNHHSIARHLLKADCQVHTRIHTRSRYVSIVSQKNFKKSNSIIKWKLVEYIVGSFWPQDIAL